MLEMPQWLLTQMHRNVRQQHPHEASGMVARRRSPSGLIDTLYRHTPMRNVDPNPRSGYAWEAEDQLLLWDQMEIEGTEPWIIYHSHTETDPEPSSIDHNAAWFPGVHYLIFSTAAGAEDVWYQSYLCTAPGELLKEEVRVTT